MLRVFTIRAVRESQRTVLEVWPFGMRDAANLLENLDVDTPGFVAVDDGKWDDGFHPPKVRNLSGIHENCLWTDFMPVELHRYEQIEKLAKVAHSAVVA